MTVELVLRAPVGGELQAVRSRTATRPTSVRGRPLRHRSRPSPPTTLDDAVRNLRRLILAAEHYRQAVSDAIGLGTTESQAVSVLALHGERGQSELARDLQLTSSASTALVDRLERQGVAERTRHPHDRRRTIVRLTDRGRQIAAESQQLPGARPPAPRRRAGSPASPTGWRWSRTTSTRVAAGIAAGEHRPRSRPTPCPPAEPPAHRAAPPRAPAVRFRPCPDLDMHDTAAIFRTWLNVVRCRTRAMNPRASSSSDAWEVRAYLTPRAGSHGLPLRSGRGRPDDANEHAHRDARPSSGFARYDHREAGGRSEELRCFGWPRRTLTPRATVTGQSKTLASRRSPSQDSL